MMPMTRQRLSLNRRGWQFLPLLLAFLLLGAGSAGALLQSSSAAPTAAPVTDTYTAPQESAGAERLHLLVGRSLVITSPGRLKRVSIADPNIADAVIVSPSQILINAKAPGGVSLVLWDESDVSQTFDLRVDIDLLGLSQKLREVFPQEPVKLEAAKDVVMISGQVSSKEVAERIFQLVSAASPKAINLLQVPLPPAPGEILLEVKFAEVNRSAISQLGLNIFSTGATNTIGSISTQQFSPPGFSSLTVEAGNPSSTEFRFTDVLNVFAFRPDINLGATIRAMEQKNLLQILAEPNLLTQVGKEASFLAGGEFPFPVLQSGATSNAVTIQFKEFGVRLSFTPTITPEGKIHLKVRPEVSALDFTNSLTLQGFFIPALSTRRVESEMDLEDGQSFVIAGLVDDRLTQTVQKIPLLGDVPILGKLFNSRTKNKTKTELLVMVTPRRVKSLSPGQAPPGPQFPQPFMPPAAPEKSGAPAKQ